MRLTVRAFSSADVGTYHCVSTNSLGRAEGTLRLYGKCKLNALNYRSLSDHFLSLDLETFKRFWRKNKKFTLLILTLFTEIKIHPGLSATDSDQVNIIGGE